MKRDEPSARISTKILCNFWIMLILYRGENADRLVPSAGDAMSNSSPKRNKAIVLEGFETLFNKRDYAAAERFWSPNYIQHSAHIAPVAKDYSISCAHYRRRCTTKISSTSPKAIMPWRMADSQVWEGPPPGSPPTLSGSKTVFLESTGTFCRTRRLRPNLSAALPMFGDTFPK